MASDPKLESIARALVESLCGTFGDRFDEFPDPDDVKDCIAALESAVKPYKEAMLGIEKNRVDAAEVIQAHWKKHCDAAHGPGSLSTNRHFCEICTICLDTIAEFGTEDLFRQLFGSPMPEREKAND